jgi:hypothetical protein
MVSYEMIVPVGMILAFDVIRIAAVSAAVATVAILIAKRGTAGRIVMSTAWCVAIAWYLFFYYRLGKDFLGPSFCLTFSFLFLSWSLRGIDPDHGRTFFGFVFGKGFLNRMDIAKRRTTRRKMNDD